LLVKRPTDAIISQNLFWVKMNLYMFRAVPLPIIRSYLNVQLTLVYFTQIWSHETCRGSFFSQNKFGKLVRLFRIIVFFFVLVTVLCYRLYAVFLLLYCTVNVLLCYYLCCPMYWLCVLYHCHRVLTQLQLTNVSSYHYKEVRYDAGPHEPKKLYAWYLQSHTCNKPRF